MWVKTIIISIIPIFTIFISAYYYITYLPKNEFIEKSLISAISLTGGFLLAYILSKYKDENEATKSHFEDIKKLVISPIIECIQSDIHLLPPSKSIFEFHKPDDSIINYFLCSDFLNKHNPEILGLWDNTYNSIVKLDLDKKRIRSTFEIDIDKIISKIKNDPNPLIEWEIRAENLDKFKGSLIMDLINGKYNEELVEVTTLDRLVYPDRAEINPLNIMDSVFGPPQGEIVIAIPKFKKNTSLFTLRKTIIDDIKPLQIKLNEIQKDQEQLDKNSALFLTKLHRLLFKPTLDHKRCDLIK